MTSFINDRGKTPATGNVAGAASSTDNAAARFDGTGGKTLQNSGVIIDDSNNVTGVATLKATTTIGVGAATPAASGAGITFPATQSASSDANTLDDYEEGNATLTIAGSTTAGTQTYVAQVGKYVKIGILVIVNFFLQMNAKDAATSGNLQINGLPFTSDTTSNYNQNGFAAVYNVLDLNVGGALYSIGFLILPNTTVARLYESGDNVGSAQLTDVDLNATSTISGTIIYRATA